MYAQVCLPTKPFMFPTLQHILVMQYWLFAARFDWLVDCLQDKAQWEIIVMGLVILIYVLDLNIVWKCFSFHWNVINCYCKAFSIYEKRKNRYEIIIENVSLHIIPNTKCFKNEVSNK